MSVPSKVCKLSHFEWRNNKHVYYYVNDSCHDPDCYMILEFDIDHHNILQMTFWRKLCWFDDVSGKGSILSEKYKHLLDKIDNEDLKDFAGKALDFVSRWSFTIRTIYTILTKGWIELEEGFTFFEKEHVQNTIEALQEGLRIMEGTEEKPQ